MKIKIIIVCLFAYSFSFFIRTEAAEKDRITINLKVNEIIEFDNFYLLLGVKNDDIYRVLINKNEIYNDSENIYRVLVGYYYDFNIEVIKPINIGFLNKYYCMCRHMENRGTIAHVYNIEGKYITLPFWGSDTKIYYGEYIPERLDQER